MSARNSKIRVSREKLITLPFALIVASGLAYFIALAMLNPVFGPYVKDRLGLDDSAVGVSFGFFAAGAIILRPIIGRVGDTIGRRPLLIGGAISVAAATASYGAFDTFGWFLAMRAAAGLGEAAFFVGAATMITDRAPADRRGEALSYWSIAVYGGLSLGPVLGEVLLGGRKERFILCWVVAAGISAIAATIGLFVSEVDDRPPPPAKGGALLHRSALGPGLVLFLGFVSLAGWSGFVKLYARDDLGIENVGAVFFIYGAIVLGIRVVGATLPDRLGPIVAGTFALGFGSAGIALVVILHSAVGLYLGTAVFAIGQSLAYPALLVLALSGVNDSERASVVGTFSAAFDLAMGLGGFICGVIAESFGYRWMFGTSAVLAIVGITYLRSAPGLRRS